jgi:hypothetical protein
VTLNDDLPPVYHEWVNRSQGVSERWVLQQAVEAAYSTLSEPLFEVTPIHDMVFKNFRFAGSAHFDIGTGILLFSVTPGDIPPLPSAVDAGHRQDPGRSLQPWRRSGEWGHLPERRCEAAHPEWLRPSHLERGLIPTTLHSRAHGGNYGNSSPSHN